MKLAVLKEKIHTKIELSDKKVLEAIYTLLENQQQKSFDLTDEEAEEIEQDIADFLSGKTKAYSLEEVKINIKR